jgi:UDP-glucose 4-epimerase
VNEIADIAVRECGLGEASVRYRHTGGDRGWKGDVPKPMFNVQKIKALGWRCGRTSAEAIRDSMRAMIIELDAHVSRRR